MQARDATSVRLRPGSRPWGRRVSTFLTIYLACALMFGLGGATPEWGPDSLLEAFSAGLFGMLAVTALVLARQAGGWRRAFWVVSMIALVAFALDEVLEVHESVGLGLAGDPFKVLLWVGAGGALAFVHWLERPSRGAQRAMLLGFVLHGLYLVAEVGDGGYFRLPYLSEQSRELIEGLAELSMLSAYLLAFGEMAAESSAVAVTPDIRPAPESRRDVA